MRGVPFIRTGQDPISEFVERSSWNSDGCGASTVPAGRKLQSLALKNYEAMVEMGNA